MIIIIQDLKSKFPNVLFIILRHKSEFGYSYPIIKGHNKLTITTVNIIIIRNQEHQQKQTGPKTRRESFSCKIFWKIHTSFMHHNILVHTYKQIRDNKENTFNFIQFWCSDRCMLLRNNQSLVNSTSTITIDQHHRLTPSTITITISITIGDRSHTRLSFKVDGLKKSITNLRVYFVL